MMHPNDEELRELRHKEWIAKLSDEEFKEWEKGSTKFTIVHFQRLEVAIAKAIDEIQQNPHDMDNISYMGSCVESLGKMMQEYDYLGPIKMGLGHDKELEIMNRIAAIAVDIKDGVEEYYSEMYPK